MSNLPDKSNIVGGPYSYPMERDDSYRSKVVFQAIKVIPPKYQGTFNTSPTAKDVSGDGTGDKPSGPPNNTGISGIKTNVLSGESAHLYVPIGYSVTDGIQYAQNSISAVGGAALNRGATIGDATMSALKNAGQGIFDFFTGNATEASKVAALRLSSALGDKGQNTVANALRVSLNPNIRTQFQGVDIRSFSFAFEFIPKSEQESRMVRAIIDFFRFHMYPEEIMDVGSFSIAYNYPNLFRIKLLSKDGSGGAFKNIGTPIKLCYCTNVTTNYNPTMQVLHEDGSPVRIDMQVQFTEYKTLSRKDIYYQDFSSFYDFENQRTETVTDYT